MAYLHEARLKEAIKKLYMLGSSDAKRPTTSLKGLGDSVVSTGGAVINASKASKKLKADVQKQPEPAPQEEYVNQYGPGMQMFMKGTPYDRDGEVEAFEPLPDQDGTVEAEDVINRVRANQEAGETRFGGTYSNLGLQGAAQRADANASDRLYQRAMIGIGGTRRTL